MGLEEVYETQNAGSSWNTIAPYWNFAFKCFSYTPFEGTCDHNQAHSDQHAAIITGGKLYIGNDGGVYARALTDHKVGDWTNLNAHMDALQYYGAQGSGDSVIYGGMQEKRRPRSFATPTTVPDDQGNPIKVSSVRCSAVTAVTRWSIRPTRISGIRRVHRPDRAEVHRRRRQLAFHRACGS